MKQIVAAGILSFLFTVAVKAQVKEGMIHFNMDIEMDASKGMNPMSGATDVTLWFKNGKTLTEMITPLYSMKTLSEGNSTLVLMDAMGQKSFFRKTTRDDTKKKQSAFPDPAVTYTKEKKKILGYECTKALISIGTPKAGTMTMHAWITDKLSLKNPAIGPLNEEMLAKFKGTCLEIQMEQKGIKTKMTATEISTKPVPDKVFQLSTSGYTERKK